MNYLNKIPDDVATHIWQSYYEESVIPDLLKVFFERNKPQKAPALLRQNASVLKYPPSPIMNWNYINMSPLDLVKIVNIEYNNQKDCLIDGKDIYDLFFYNRLKYKSYNEYWIKHNAALKAIEFSIDKQY
tara:strand:- start:289 stop:678 length:390 start_codon:yes stop_codon:yes gene_type:complete